MLPPEHRTRIPRFRRSNPLPCSMNSDPTEKLAQARQHYRSELSAHGPLNGERLSALCDRYPDEAEELLSLHELCNPLLEASLDSSVGGGPSLIDRIRHKFGPQIDLDVSLMDPRQPNHAQVVERLAGRTNFGRYEIQAEVARGGMGSILRVWDEDLRRPLAMKVILDREGESTSADESPADSLRLSRFLEEAQVTGQLDHPGILPVHELGLDPDGRCYFTMKLVRGQTLREILEHAKQGREGWTLTRVLTVLLKICEAMAYAHAKRVIHRDLKPANIMVGRYGEVYVMDWGLARILDREDRHDLRLKESPSTEQAVVSDRIEMASSDGDSPLVTMDGDVVGTPVYMSPEQATGRLAEMGPHSDVYSVGAMLYHLLTGEMPFVPSGARPDNLAVLSDLQLGPPRPLQELAPRTPDELVAICEKAMARNIADRYPDMSQLGEDLSAFIEGRVVSAYEGGAWAEARKWIRRNRPLATALAAVILALIAGLVVALELRSEADASAELAQTEKLRADDKAEEALANAERAQEEARRADEQAARAVEQARLAEEERSKVLGLADATRLNQLESELERLYPITKRGKEMRAWLRSVEDLASHLPSHRVALSNLRRAALPKAAPVANASEQSELDRLQAQRSEWIDALMRAPDNEELERGQKLLRDLDEQIEAVHARITTRGSWSFEDPEDQWQHDRLATLIADLETFLQSGKVEEVWAQIDLAEVIAERSTTGDRAQELWDEAIASIADPSVCPEYKGLQLEPQVGLVPLGRDPDSGLWEFAHILTGLPSNRLANGELEFNQGSAVVLVLIPGGKARLGSQSTRAGDFNFDSQSTPEEQPVHEIELDPFFLSKFELSQAQWEYLTGSNPSANEEDVLLPVERVSWNRSAEVLGKFDLQMPTEAQWEYAARLGNEQRAAGQRSMDFNTIRTITSFGNDNTMSFLQPNTQTVTGGEASSIGLHGMLGNVAEWCLDAFGDYEWPSRPGDGYRNPPSVNQRVYRGGRASDESTELFTVASRLGAEPDISDPGIGLRPARPLDR